MSGNSSNGEIRSFQFPEGTIKALINNEDWLSLTWFKLKLFQISVIFYKKGSKCVNGGQQRA
jgi:hypothetical protein